jgi:Transposase DDE domain
VAGETPNAGKEESRIMQLRRLLANETLDYSVYYLPFILVVLSGLGNLPLIVIIDGSVTGRGCVTLMVSVIYQRRALPLMWVTRKGKKGHFPETIHVELIKAVQDILPQGREVTVLGDGEFDGTDWLDTINCHGWRYVCRTAKDSVFYEGDDDFRIKDICPGRGGCTGILAASFTKRRYGPLMAVAWWGRKYQEPIYLVSNLTLPEEACQLYRKRFRIETLFSDFKGRGFQLQKSGLIDPVRVSRLLIAVSLAYVWVISLGVYALKTGWDKIIHRTDRCDLSLFELGKRLLKRFSNNNIPLPPIDIFRIIKI